MSEHAMIALSGKGGVGKTTIAALLIKVLRDRGEGAVFAVDADPNSCLADYLGLEVEWSIGSLREDIIKSITDIPQGMTKERWINYRVQECIVESTGMDLLEMGRPEGPGCYCYINDLLRDYAGSVNRNYRYIVIDNEAGMEHLSRRSAETIDYLLIVSDLTTSGLKAATRIRDMSRELNLVTRHTGLILNYIEDSLLKERSGKVEETGLEVLGQVPADPILEKFGFSDGSLLDIPEESVALKAVRDLSLKLDI